MKFLQVTLVSGGKAILNMAFVKGMVEADGGSRTTITMETDKTVTVMESIPVLMKRLDMGVVRG